MNYEKGVSLTKINQSSELSITKLLGNSDKYMRVLIILVLPKKFPQYVFLKIKS